MSMTDPIADYLTRIRNAIKARHKKVEIPSSNLKREMTRILYENKFIQHYINIDDGKQGVIRIYLKYTPDNQSVIAGLKRISTPGRRVYVGVDKIPRVLNNLGIAIMSTSRGVMTNKEAKKLGVGGEVICYVW
ncbi:30S ribosomal protein S8 [candidate division KSB1 bacterium]|nr:30S ribosomal protein S8 [bacterium]OQX59218.1 MAG: 30S ribosomal protein S8 [candidate division KSB1 bacterium 4484_219]RKY80100.1 MAG: 30S ribosomal protein S8 [candidate division KSB1 bacterium]HDI51259.1 30S ribosomal protein S8 [Bacteroidota bacterium]RKY81124.1 MAG: 30S ribosomal protein S8 [candidate division KSB1 bacterium]